MEAHLTDEEIESRSQLSPVNSHNEWDPLEEIIVGRLEGATMPSNHPVVTCNIPNKAAARAQSLVAGLHYPRIMVEPAQRELDGFVALLQSFGIIVRRPEPVAAIGNCTLVLSARPAEKSLCVGLLAT